jgi:3-oxoacyl-[acyl-carrier protein] reductase
MKKFDQQVCIVTGGTRGIGAGITSHFLKEGAHVIATYYSNDQKALEFKNSLEELGKNLTLKKFNIGNYAECEKFFKEIDTEFSDYHVLVNNGGIRKDQLLPLLKEDDWDQVINTNLKGTYNMSKLVLNKFLKARYGRIVNISSMAAVMGLPGQTNYSASKAAQIAFSKSLAKEVAKRNITVNCVLPGFIETELLEGLSPELIKAYTDQVPAKRFGKVDEIASAVLYLASKEASYINGASLEVSGGL